MFSDFSNLHQQFGLQIELKLDILFIQYSHDRPITSSQFD